MRRRPPAKIRTLVHNSATRLVLSCHCSIVFAAIFYWLILAANCIINITLSISVGLLTEEEVKGGVNQEEADTFANNMLAEPKVKNKKMID